MFYSGAFRNYKYTDGFKKVFIRGNWVDCYTRKSATKEEKKGDNYLGMSFKIMKGGRAKHLRVGIHCFK